MTNRESAPRSKGYYWEIPVNTIVVPHESDPSPDTLIRLSRGALDLLWQEAVTGSLAVKDASVAENERIHGEVLAFYAEHDPARFTE